jgi:hypothetical protein
VQKFAHKGIEDASMKRHFGAILCRVVFGTALLIGVSHTSASQMSHDKAGADKSSHQLICFGGQVRVNGKRLTFRPFEILAPNEGGTGCGNLVRKGKTDQHGHFLIEPLGAGEYYARFDDRGVEEVVGFTLLHNYDKCDAGHVEIKFLPDGRSTIQQDIEVDVDLSDCDPEEAYCFRR